MLEISNKEGERVESYVYNVFGKPYTKTIDETGTEIITNLKKSSIGNTRLYTGREYDRGLGLYYNRARYYDPNLGRFIARDPIGIADDVNLYSYVKNNPTGFTDIFGLAAKAFVKAYDEYSDIKKQIYGVLPGSMDYTFTRLSEEERQKWFDELNKKRDIARNLHYDRNKYNDELPSSEYEAHHNGWIKMSDKGSALHQIDVPEDQWNAKWVSDNGLKEVIFHYKTGQIVRDEKNVGTYNFYPTTGENGSIRLHKKYDLNPYIEWGNGWNDTSTIEQRSCLLRSCVIKNTR